LLPLDNQQLNDWFAFYELHPFGDIRDDMRAAQQTYYAWAGNPHVNHDRPMQVSDFMLLQINDATMKQKMREEKMRRNWGAFKGQLAKQQRKPT